MSIIYRNRVIICPLDTRTKNECLGNRVEWPMVITIVGWLYVVIEKSINTLFKRTKNRLGFDSRNNSSPPIEFTCLR